MIRLLERKLDRLTMYRLMLYYLEALLGAAFVFGFLQLVPHEPSAIAFSTALILATCYITNCIFARVFGVPANNESVYITALILALILDPTTASDTNAVGAMIFVSVWAMASKFIFAIGRKHIFNPAAFGVALSALLLDQPPSWWVGGNLAQLPLVVIGGLVVVHKLRRFDLVTTFVLVNLATVLLTSNPAQYQTALIETVQSSPLFFFAFVMLTEPLTAPTMRWPSLAFAAIVAFLTAPNIHIDTFYFTPEIALLVGNLFAYTVSPKGRFVLTLERIEQSAHDTYDFIFRSSRTLPFQAGQYLEWTLGLDHPDNRGNRRYFTVASSPTEETIRLGVKFYPKSSAFKRALATMIPGERIYASQLSGDFTLPANPNEKIAFLAGGIGITPFRSMVQYLLDHDEARPIVVIHGIETPHDIAYRDTFEAAQHNLGIRTIYAVARGAENGQYCGRIDARLVQAAIKDYRERTFYISGPQTMVRTLREMLQSIGVRRSRIKVDYFPGFG
ncbi:MAG: hypothetical protein AAAB35_04725 [Phyllobacterium sp.]|uniref:hypothetical protein n=1 Tax=Phyllobacterium sp. TaxID=1871046 RepID=UPI0030F25BF8